MTDTTSYTDHACILTVSGWEIPAAITLPLQHAETAELPCAILLVPGSLFSDVNGDYPSWNSFPHVYAHLAHQLAAHGHAVYRFAKLGRERAAWRPRRRPRRRFERGTDASSSRPRRSTQCDASSRIEAFAPRERLAPATVRDRSS